MKRVLSRRNGSYFSTNMRPNMIRTSKFQIPEQNIEIHTYPGSRVIEMKKNLSNSLINSIQDKLTSYEENILVNALLFETPLHDDFDVDRTDLKNENTLQAMNSLSLNITNYKKPTITIYLHKTNGSGFGGYFNSFNFVS